MSAALERHAISRPPSLWPRRRILLVLSTLLVLLLAKGNSKGQFKGKEQNENENEGLMATSLATRKLLPHPKR
jgi:hypothetical protein